MTNLLQNPGFEAGWWRKTHTGHEFGEIFVPEGWVAFWKEGKPVPHDPSNEIGYGRPEMHVINKEPPFLDPMRIHTGQRAFKLFTFFRIHDAGLYQQITDIPSGSQVRALGWAHAWSSNHDNPHASDGVGEQAFFVRASEYDKEDGVRNVTFTVGIDPTGGTDPWSDQVIWGEGAHIYNAFGQIPPVEVTAQADTVTVFVRSAVLWPFKHCDSYFDDMLLEVLTPSVRPIEVEMPDEVNLGEPFDVRATGGSGPRSLQLELHAESLFYREREIEGEHARWRCLAVEPGTYDIEVSSADVPSVTKSLNVKEETVEPGVECVPPRVPYARTYVLLPPDAGKAWVEAILDSGKWDEHRWTIGSSADDAGVGPTDRRVIAINPEDWPDSLRDFFNIYYPGVNYTAIRADTPGALQQALRNL
jgi:hypothetical protein